MTKRVVLFCFTVAVALTAARSAFAGSCGGCNGCSECSAAAPCETQYVERTVHVPTMVTESRRIVETHYRYEPREKPYTVYRCVPETRPVTREYTVMVPQMRTRTVNYSVLVPYTRQVSRNYNVTVPVWRTVEEQYTVSVPEWKEVEQHFTVMVPHQEPRQGVRTVCRVVPETQTRTITKDCGHWVTQTVEVPCRSHCGNGCGDCGGCGTRTVCQRVWQPQIVQQEVHCTVYRRHLTNENYQYMVTVCRPEPRSKMVRVCSYRTEPRVRHRQVCDLQIQQKTAVYNVTACRSEPRSRQEHYTVCVPQTKSHTYNVTTYRQVPEERIAKYTVCVPYQVERDVQVRVCRMVPKTVTVAVNAGCGGCGGCSRCCH